MRKSFHTLSGLVRNKIGGDPMNGDVYIFVNKRRNRIKLLHYEKEDPKRQMKQSLEVYIQGVKDEMRGMGRMK